MPSEMRFAAVRAILEKVGYRLIRVRGSHHVFSIPVHRGKVKSVYVRQAVKLAAEEQDDDEENQEEESTDR